MLKKLLTIGIVSGIIIGGLQTQGATLVEQDYPDPIISKVV